MLGAFLYCLRLFCEIGFLTGCCSWVGSSHPHLSLLDLQVHAAVPCSSHGCRDQLQVPMLVLISTLSTEPSFHARNSIFIPTS